MVVFLTAAGCASAEKVHESSASALYSRGISLINKGKYQQAKELFREYIATYEDTHLYPISLYYLGYCYQKLNDAEQALSIYHKVIDQSPDEFWTEMARKRIGEIEEDSL